MSARILGIDYGTTNSAMAMFEGDELKLGTFHLDGQPTQVFRSVLYCSYEESEDQRKPVLYAGPKAIEQYLEEGGTGRWIQSTKSFLGSPSFDGTYIYNRFFRVEDMVAAILQRLRKEVETQWGDLGNKAVIGRPVRFVGAKKKKTKRWL